MEFVKGSKSKKLLIGGGIIGIIVVGFFMLKFMSSGGADMVPERPRTAHKAKKKITEPAKKKVQEKSPLFQAMEALKDPFRTEDRKVAELQEKINLTQKEIEYLKATLEEKKLREEIKQIERSLSESGSLGISREKTGTVSPEGEEAQAEPQERVVVKAILITDEMKSALIISGNKKIWVHENDQFDGWKIKQIKKDRVLLLRAGKTYVFFYDRPSSIIIEG